jgi:hypothetical protein
MHDKSLRKIESDLRKISNEIRELDFNSSHKSMMHDDISYSLPKEPEELFVGIINKILKHRDFQSKFSSKYVEEKVKLIFANIVKNNNVDVNTLLKEMINKLSKFDEEITVYMKLMGIEIEFCCKFGNVKLMPGESFLLKQLKKQVKSINDQTLGDSSSKQHALSFMFKDLEELCKLNSGNSTCVSCFKVIAEPIRAKERAIEEIERVIDLMNYFAKSLNPRENIKINAEGINPTSIRNTISFTSKNINTSMDNIGTPTKLKINNETLNHIEEINGFILSDIIAKKDLTQFEECLIKCLHWFSIALNQEESTNSFLFNIIALESLFKQVSGSSISGTVSESVSFILQNNKDNRLQLVKKMRKYYSKRSAVAHGGKTVIADSDLMELYNIVGTLIMILAKKTNEFNTQNQLTEWVDEIKFS